jgi:hypothetical protein
MTHLLLILALAAGVTSPPQPGDRRDKVENEHGFPFTEGTARIGERVVQVARYASQGVITVTAYYVKDACVAMRFTSRGEMTEEEVATFLKRYALDDARWLSISHEVAGRAEKGAQVSEKIARYECTKLTRKRTALVTHSTRTRPPATTPEKAWDVYLFDETDKDIALMIHVRRL